MLATLEKTEHGYTATFNRQCGSSLEKVWNTLTKNDKLQHWMPNLEMTDLRKNGKIKFNMNDGTGKAFDISILDYEEMSYLQFEWGEGTVRFELELAEDECILTLKEYIPALNNHISKDLAGWHICLDRFHEVLEGRRMDFPKESWEEKYEDYKKIVNALSRRTVRKTPASK